MKKVFICLTSRAKVVVLAVVLGLMACGPVEGRDNFRMSGTLEGVDKDVLLIEYITFEPDRKVVRKRVDVRDGRFEFSTSLKNAWLGQLRLKSVPERANKGFFIYLVPDEELTLRGDLRAGGENYKFEVGGSAYYQDLAQVREFTRPYQEEFAATARAFSEGTDAGEDASVLLQERLRADRKIGERYAQVCEAYVISETDGGQEPSGVDDGAGKGDAAVQAADPRRRGFSVGFAEGEVCGAGFLGIVVCVVYPRYSEDEEDLRALFRPAEYSEYSLFGH